MSVPPPDRCVHCGADLPNKATFCRECGASDESGWRESDDSEGLAYDGSYESDEFDYDEFVAREFGDLRKQPWTWQQAMIWIGILALTIWCIISIT